MQQHIIPISTVMRTRSYDRPTERGFRGQLHVAIETRISGTLRFKTDLREKGGNSGENERPAVDHFFLKAVDFRLLWI